jgi:hypothetical protein
MKKDSFNRPGDRNFGMSAPPVKSKRQQKDIPPDKEVLKQYGGTGKKAPTEGKRPAGNVEIGFIQRTPKQATGGMMGRAPPPSGGKTHTRADGRPQFKKARGKKVF